MNAPIPHPSNAPGPIAWNWEWHQTLDSTNHRAMASVLAQWAQDRTAEGLIIAARRQTAGRGQHGRAWASPEGGLYFSAVVENVPIDVRHRLALLVGVALADTIARAGPFFPRIRWPNDLLLHGKKVAGILCEAISQGDRWAAVVGIGINLNTNVAELPEDIRAIATSLLERDGQTRRLDTFAHEVAVALDACLRQVREKGLECLVDRVRKLDGLVATHVRLLHGGSIVEGTGAGLADDGSLRLRLADGTIQSFQDGSISGAAP